MHRFARVLAAPTVLLALAVGMSVVPDGHAEDAQPQVAQPDKVHSRIASAVAATLMSGHYSKRPIHDATSERWLTTYLDTLDYSRTYFLASDIAEFEARYATTLDDDLMSERPTLAAGFEIYGRYLQRVDERIGRALAMLDGELDFSDPEATVDPDHHDDPWASTPEELDALWSRRLRAEVLRMELASLDEDRDPVERLRGRYERLRKDVRDMDADDILEMYLGALTRSYDPHSSWLKPISKENFDIDMSDSLTGIGAVLQSQDGYTVIKELIPGGPAESSGELSPEDRIVAVAQGEGGEEVDIVDMRIDRVVQLIRGEVGTIVQLTVEPADGHGASDIKRVIIERDKVKLADAAAKGEVRELSGPEGEVSVGVLDVPSFYVDTEAIRAGEEDAGSTANDMRRILMDWRGQGVDVALIDLRHNGGGSLDQALQATGLFLDGGPVVQIRDRDGRLEPLEDPDPGVVWTGPVVVLTSEMSASASEIFAAALQDRGRGLVVGATSTHGKGTVQNLVGLDRFLRRMGTDVRGRGGAMKFTTHMFFGVDGDSTQIRGVPSDVVLPSPYEGMDVKEEDLDHPLAWDRTSRASYTPRDLGVDLPALRARSSERVTQSMEFAFLREDLEERARRDGAPISLHRATREAELERAERRSEHREQARKAAGWDGEAEIDPVLDEAVQIARDMVTLRKG